MSSTSYRDKRITIHIEQESGVKGDGTAFYNHKFELRCYENDEDYDVINSNSNLADLFDIAADDLKYLFKDEE